MLSRSDLEELASYAGQTPVLSLYVGTDLMEHTKEGVRLAVRNALKNLAGSVPEAEVERVLRYLDYEYDWRSRGLAIFSAGDELWRVIPLPASVSTQAYYSPKPYLKVLADIMDRFGPYFIALVDRTALRLFSVNWGTIQSETEAAGEQFKRHKQGGWSATKYQRQADNLALQNLKNAVEVLRDYCESRSEARLVLAGSQEVLTELRDLMPQPLRERVIGEISASMTDSPNELLSRSLALVEQKANEEERTLVSEVITAARKGGNGAIGLADTLYNLYQGRARLMLVEEGFGAPGYACPACGYVSAEIGSTCPLCGHEGMDPVEDVVNRAVQRAVETGADVNIIRNNPELAEAGHIAALLRY